MTKVLFGYRFFKNTITQFKHTY